MLLVTASVWFEPLLRGRINALFLDPPTHRGVVPRWVTVWDLAVLWSMLGAARLHLCRQASCVPSSLSASLLEWRRRLLVRVLLGFGDSKSGAAFSAPRGDKSSATSSPKAASLISLTFVIL